MGNFNSQLLPLELEELSRETSLTHQEIKKLYKRFITLDKENKSFITLLEFMSIPELVMNPLANRILKVFDKNSRSELNFREFISNLSVFSLHTKRDTKLQFAFDVYDVDGDGFIDSRDLFYIIKLLVTYF